MQPDARLGLTLLCLMTGIPFAAGAALAWWFRGRVDAYGIPGALMPKFIRNRWTGEL